MKTLQIQADPKSLMCNITKFFSNPDACIQELLQNARRAGATEVDVDISADRITISDNGHGVYDPQRLITIGGSEWQTGVTAEVPAGMGLFSCFQICNEITIRSADWMLHLNYEKLCQGIGPTLEEDFDVIKGTVIEILKPKVNGKRLDHFLFEPPFSSLYYDSTKYKTTSIITFASKWADAALYMPYRTQISIEKGENPHATAETQVCVEYQPQEEEQRKVLYQQNMLIVPKFDMDKIDEKSNKMTFEWGEIRVAAHARYSRKHADKKNTVKIVTQGIALSQAENIPPEIELTVFIKPGFIDLRLPDRNDIILNDKTKRIITEAKVGLAETLIHMLNDTRFNETESKWLSAALLEISPHRMGEIPAEKRCVKAQTPKKHGSFVLHMSEVRRYSPILTFHIEDPRVVRKFVERTVYELSNTDCDKAFVDGLPSGEQCYDRITCQYEPDPRAEADECVYILYKIVMSKDGQVRKTLEPEYAGSVLLQLSDTNPLDEQNISSDWNLVLIHTQPHCMVDDPDMDYFHNYMDFDGYSSDEVWDDCPIQDFLLNQGCKTFVTEGRFRDICKSLDRYSKGLGLLRGCDISFRGGELTIDCGWIHIENERKYFKNVEGRAEFTEERQPPI